MTGKRYLVFGGRDFTDRAALFDSLDRLHAKMGISCIIEGEAGTRDERTGKVKRGADLFAREWAEERGVPFEPYPAAWTDLDAPGAVIRQRRDGTLYNAKAGHDRNKLMRDKGKPDGGVMFPGGTGTANMCRLLDQADPRIKIWLPMRKRQKPAPASEETSAGGGLR